MLATDIMIIEDDPDVRSALVELLADEGYPTRAVSNGAEALGELEHAAPRLILLDLLMPVMDGWTFRAHQLDDPEWARIPVVVLSAIAGVESAASLAADAYLAKPAFAERVLGIVSALYNPTTTCGSCGRAVLPRRFGDVAFCRRCMDEATDTERDVGGGD